MHSLIGLVVGVIFGVGLALSGMTDTQKVIGFLDLFGAWDITLMFVMGSGLLVSFPTYQYFKRKPRPIFDSAFHLPTSRVIDRRLLSGAVLFGVGWGIYGYCPGPAISSLVYGESSTVVFVVAMAVGMMAANLVPQNQKAEG